LFVEDELLKKPRNEALVEFVRVINTNVQDLLLEIKKAADEFTGEFYYVLVCDTMEQFFKICIEDCMDCNDWSRNYDDID